MSPKPRVVIVVRVQYTLVAHEQLTKRDDDSAPMAQPDGRWSVPHPTRPLWHSHAVPEQARTILPTAVTVARALVVARWLTLLWMIGIVVVSSDRHAIDHPLVA